MIPFITALLLWATALAADTHASDIGMCPLPARAENLRAPDLPELGKWMIDHSGSPAHWLGELYEGKKLREPINVVIIDAVATNPEAAKQRIVEASTHAGYPARMGHSAGYRAMIGSEPYSQLPTGWDDAFSNHLFETTNNHGRLFGPHRHGGSYVFVGAFSREAVSVFHWPEHRYASFNKARDEYANSLERKTPFKIAGYIDMQNAIIDDPSVTTGDHDGKAVVLCAADEAAAGNR